MRTIYFHCKDNADWWVSPDALWQALRSNESLAIVSSSHSIDIGRAMLAASTAVVELQQKWLFDARGSLISALWCLCAALALLWPPLAAKVPGVVQKVLFCSLGIGILAEIVSVAKKIRQKNKVSAMVGAKMFSDARWKFVKLARPAAFYRQDAGYSSPQSVKAVTICFLALFLLNSVVLAFPGHPAVVLPSGSAAYTVKYPQVVMPGTKWDWREEYYTGESVAVLAAPEGTETVWVTRVLYRVHRTNMLADAGPWKEWIAGRLSWLTSQITDSIWQSLPPNMENGERIIAIVDAFGSMEIKSVLTEALTNHFNEHHQGIMKISVIYIEVVEIPISDYLTIAKAQKE